MLFFAESSFAAASAPVRADRNTGFVELFAIIAIFNPAAWDAGAFAAGAFCSPPQAASHRAVTESAVVITLFIMSPSRAMRSLSSPCSTCGGLRQAAGGEPGARTIEHDRDDRGAPDDDPFVVLVEVQRADRLADEDDQQRAEHRVHRAALAPRQARPADHCRR